jgi:hypothetical protein
MRKKFSFWRKKFSHDEVMKKFHTEITDLIPVLIGLTGLKKQLHWKVD